jgi:hypothetical protein
MGRQSIDFPTRQKKFLKRKVEEIKKLVPADKQGRVSESMLVQGLVDVWMALEAKEIHEKRAHKKLDDP